MRLAFVACSLFQVPAILRKLSILDIGKVFLGIGSSCLAAIQIIQPTAIAPAAWRYSPQSAAPCRQNGDAGHIPTLRLKLSCTKLAEWRAECRGGIHMRKISVFAGVAALFLIGVGAWIGVGTWTSTSAVAGSTIDPFWMMVNAKNLALRRLSRR